jgi:hypothetical protein
VGRQAGGDERGDDALVADDVGHGGFDLDAEGEVRDRIGREGR